MTLFRNLVLVLVFTIVYGDEHNHIVSMAKNGNLICSVQFWLICHRMAYAAAGVNCLLPALNEKCVAHKLMKRFLHLIISVWSERRSNSMDEYSGPIWQSARNVRVFFVAILSRNQTVHRSLPWNVEWGSSRRWTRTQRICNRFQR